MQKSHNRLPGNMYSEFVQGAGLRTAGCAHSARDKLARKIAVIIIKRMQTETANKNNNLAKRTKNKYRAVGAE